MTDEQNIDEAYDSIVRQLFSIFFGTFTEDLTPAEIAEAEQRFQSGMERARRARDRAKQLI